MKKSIIIIILIAIFVSIVLLLDWPGTKDVLSIQEEINRYSDLIEEKRELVSKTEQLKQAYNSKQEDIKKVYYVLPKEKQIPELIVQFEALASGNGLILEDLSIQEKKRAQKTKKEEEQRTSEVILQEVETLKISLKVTGTYSSFESFLKTLESNVRIMDIQDINFNSKENKQEENLFIDFDVELEAYYR